MRKTNALLTCLILLAALGCAPTPVQGPVAAAPIPDCTQVVFDPSKDSALTRDRVAEVTEDFVETAIDGEVPSPLEFWTMDSKSAHLIYTFKSTPPANTTTRAIARHRERQIAAAVDTVVAIMDGILRDRPRTTPFLETVLMTVKWRMPGATSLLVPVGSDLMQVSDGISFEAAVPSLPAFTDWAAKRGLAKGTLTGLTVVCVYSDTSRLDEQCPGRSVKIEQLWTNLLKGVGGATDVTVIAGPFNPRRFARPRSRGRRKAPLLSRLRNLWRGGGSDADDALVTRVINKSTISKPVAGATLDDNVTAEIGAEPREFDPTSHPDDARAAADQLLDPLINEQEGVVAEVQARRNKFSPLHVYWLGLAVTVLGEYFLAFTLLVKLGLEKLYAAVLALGLSMTFVALLMALRATKRRAVIYILCVVVLVALGALAVIRMEDLAESEDTSILFNAAVTVVMIVAAAGLPALIELIASRYAQAAEIERELKTETVKLDDLVDRKEAAIEYEAKMRTNTARYRAMYTYVSKLVRAMYPNSCASVSKDAADTSVVTDKTNEVASVNPTASGDGGVSPTNNDASANPGVGDDH